MDKKEIPLESVIVKAIVSALKGAGYSFVFKTHGSAYAPSGLPDLLVINHNGRFVGLEVKRPEIGKVTDLQEKMIQKIMIAGGYAEVVHSSEEALGAMKRSESMEGKNL